MFIITITCCISTMTDVFSDMPFPLVDLVYKQRGELSISSSTTVAAPVTSSSAWRHSHVLWWPRSFRSLRQSTNNSHFSLIANCSCANERMLYNPLHFDNTTNNLFFFVIVWNKPSLIYVLTYSLLCIFRLR